MKVFALGGAGEFGESAVRALAASDEVDALVVGGRTLERVERLARRIRHRLRRQADCATAFAPATLAR